MGYLVRWLDRPAPLALLVVFAACGTNAPPSVAASTVLVLQGLPEALTLTSGDPDADALTFTVTRPPGHGALSGTAPALTYTSASDYIGPDSFELTVSDGRLDASATIGLSVEPVRGPSLENTVPIDGLFLGLLRNLPSGGLAVAAARDGKVVFARGYGHATRDLPMQPSSRSRIASVSKLVAMAAVMHLVEATLLRLDDRLLDVAPDLGPPVDPRASAITIRTLLEHSSGLPEDGPGNSLFWLRSTLGAEVSCADKVRLALATPLAGTPGGQYRYSNMGFCALSTVVERVTGQDYQRYARDEVLAPMGIHGMRFEAQSSVDRPPDEVTYFDLTPCAETTRDQCRVLSTTGGATAWTASMVDLARLLEGLNRGYLRPETLALVMTPSAHDPGTGLAVELLVQGGKTWAGHSGALDSSTGLYAWRRADGWSWTLMVNNARFGRGWDPFPVFAAAIPLLDAGVDLGPMFPSTDLGPYDGL